MSLETTTLSQLDQRLTKFFDGDSRAEETWNLLRSAVVVSSKPDTGLWEPFETKFGATTLKEKVLLALFQWYTTDEIRVCINLWLEEHWGSEYSELKQSLQLSKLMALGAILEQNLWSDRDFFGNVLIVQNWSNKIFRRCFRTIYRRKPKRLVRRRGYNDHGTLRLPHESEPSYPTEKLLSVVQLEERRELQRQSEKQFFLQVKERVEFETKVS